jgi:hypothetical protein
MFRPGWSPFFLWRLPALKKVAIGKTFNDKKSGANLFR